MIDPPFTLDSSTLPRARFARFVSEPVEPDHEARLRSELSANQSLVVDLTDTMALSADWWRLLGLLGAFARRTGGQVTVVGANSVGLRTADRVGASAHLTFDADAIGAGE